MRLIDLDKKLTRNEKYLQILGQRLLSKGSRADILLAGGAVVVLLLHTRDATKDIGAYFSGDVGTLRTEVSAIANEFDLRPDCSMMA